MKIASNGALISEEFQRGCGYRKAGGMYLVSGTLWRACGILPIPDHNCECCDRNYLVPSRAPKWIKDSRPLFDYRQCSAPANSCLSCWFNVQVTKPNPDPVMLVWIGERHYRTSEQFVAEALQRGISRRINSIPRGFKVGETNVFLAHRKTFMGLDENNDPILKPAIFARFVPQEIEYIVTEETSKEAIEALKKRGLTPVIVKKMSGEQEKMFDEG